MLFVVPPMTPLFGLPRIVFLTQMHVNGIGYFEIPDAESVEVQFNLQEERNWDGVPGFHLLSEFLIGVKRGGRSKLAGVSEDTL